MRYKYIDKGRAHLHTLDGKALVGTSTAIKAYGGDKVGGLIWWASGKALESFGWMNPKKNSVEATETALSQGFERVRSLTPQEYATLVSEAYRAHHKHKEEAAEKGTARHKVLENYVRLCLSLNGGNPIPLDAEEKGVEEFIKWAQENIKKFLWAEVHTYSEKFWLGGIADFGAEMKDGLIIVGDFKSSPEAYPDQFWQAATYGIQLKETGGLTPDGDQIFPPLEKIDGYMVVPFGASKVVPKFVYDVEGCEEAALAALTLHKKSITFNELIV